MGAHRLLQLVQAASPGGGEVQAPGLRIGRFVATLGPALGRQPIGQAQGAAALQAHRLSEQALADYETERRQEVIEPAEGAAFGQRYKAAAGHQQRR